MSVTNTDTQIDLVINRMSRQIYDHLKEASEIREDQLYLIDEDNLNAENQRILNVASPLLSDDAANKAYVDALSDEYQAKGDYALLSDLSAKSSIYITDPYYSEVSNLTDLNIVKLTRAEYYELVLTSSVLSDTIYIVSATTINAYDLRIENVAEPELSNDVATKSYVDKLSDEYQTKGNYLTAHQSLSNYYNKSETNALSTTFRDGLAESATTLSGYGITDAKIEDQTIILGTSSITPLTSVPVDYKTYSDTLSSLSANSYVTETLLSQLSTILTGMIDNKVTMKIWDDSDPIPED